MRIYLVRHPQPLVEPGICYGSTDLAVALEEHHAAVQRIASALPKSAALYASPLRRCAEFAAHLAQALGCTDPVHDARLAEMDFGTWEMRAWSELPRAEIDAWAADLVGYRAGGGETVLQLAQRVREFHADLLRSGHECAIVVCHAGSIRMLLACANDLALPDIARIGAQSRERIGYGEVVAIDY